MHSKNDTSKSSKTEKDWEMVDIEKIPEYMEKIGRIFQERRISLKKEIKDVASSLHITPARLERIEAGNHANLPIGLFRLLCIELKLDPQEVMGWALT